MAVDTEINDGVAVITMNRPRALNAFDTEQLRRLKFALDTVGRDPRARVAILIGAGDRAFAAGADIKEMSALSTHEAREFGRLGHAVTAAIERLPQPVIAAVNGYAFGGGCEIAIACDIRIASDNARFAQPEVGLGIPPGWGGTQRLARLIGPGLAAEMIFTGRHVHADEALRIGLVNNVHPLERLMDAAREIAVSISGNSPSAVRAAKRLMSLTVSANFGVGLATEVAEFGAAFSLPDRAEGMQAFIEKRPAMFEDPE